MALTERARKGLRLAADLEGVDVEVYKEKVLEREGNHFAQQADANEDVARAKKVRNAPEPLKAQIDALPDGGK